MGNSRFWLKNEENAHELHFCPYDEDLTVLKFVQDKEDGDCFWYTSEMLNVGRDCICCDDVDDAKDTFESMVMCFFEDQRSYYEDLCNKFFGR